MSRVGAIRMKEDEWDIDYDDTRGFLIEQWKTVNDLHKLSPADLEQTDNYTDRQAFSGYVYKEQQQARQSRSAWKANLFPTILQLDRQLLGFEGLIQELIEAVDSETVDMKRPIDTTNLWRLAYLNIKLAIESQAKLKSTTRWMNELRRSLELLISAIRVAIEHKTINHNSIRLELIDVFEPVISLMKSSILYLQRHFNDNDFTRSWLSSMEPKVKESLESLSSTIKHLRDVSANSVANHAQQKRYITDLGGLRERGIPMDGKEKPIFPADNLPNNLRTEHFTGREKNIEKIHDCLGVDSPTLRKFNIYGRRGIGKTQIALEYARRFGRFYDAIFWVQAETKASLRQSFTEIALKLELEGADSNTTFDENLSLVLRWLRLTTKKWLLIYDNAERQQTLKGYWPTEGRGAMLLTSRAYYNFFENEHLSGETVQLFNDEERRALLLAHLGDAWQTKYLRSEDMMYEIEEAAISTLLHNTGGLPIAIMHAAKLILDRNINTHGTVRSFMEMFKDSFETLPPRQSTERDQLIHSLDTIWKIAFDNLNEYAKVILSGLALLSPDSILIDLFLPSDQSMLTKKMEFCRTTPSSSNIVLPAPSIQTVINPSANLQAALDELHRKGLISRLGRKIAIHRTVQEAVNYRNSQELKENFESMVSLLYDAFPKQREGRPLTESWGWCRTWIQHVIALAYKYKLYTWNRPEEQNPLRDMDKVDLFIRLLANSAWYLYEIADYDECLTLIALGRGAARDKKSLHYAHLLNTEGTTHYEMNKISLSRRALQETLEIREIHLPENDGELANVYANLGNAETAEGNLDLAMEYLEKAAHIREGIGDKAAVLLALNYLQIGRVLALKEQFTAAYTMYQKSEGVLNKEVGRNSIFTANLHFAYGNLELVQREFRSAARSFDRTRKIMKDYNPMHPLMAAAFYKLACCEFEQDNHKKALGYLAKAQDIAEIRSGFMIDGTVARIMWKRGEVMSDDPLESQKEAAQFMENMEFKQREIAEQLGIDLQGLDQLADKEKSFDLLVPGYFR